MTPTTTTRTRPRPEARRSASAKTKSIMATHPGVRLEAIVKIIWRLVWAGQLALLLLLAGDNQLKCLCERGPERSPRAQLLSPLAGDINKQVIGADESAWKQLLDNRQWGRDGAGAGDWFEDVAEAPDAQRHSSADDLRAGEQSAAASDVTIPIIDNQKALRAVGAQTNSLIGARERHPHSTSHYERLQEGESSFLFQHGAAARKCPQQADCEQAPGRRKQVFCASDGRVYESLCAMRRSACQLNVTLHRMKSLAHCQRLKWPLKTSDNLPALRSPRAHSSWPGTELARSGAPCSRGHYDKFKLALWHEFNGQAELMFEYLDLNGDQMIEARELWPRHRAEPANESVELQADFLFQPHFHWSPCALSHLMLYELKHEGAKFDRDSFSRIFAPLGQQQGFNEVKSTRQTDTTHIHLRLGDSKILSCLSKQLQADLELGLGHERATCSWWRRGTNLASLRDEHIRLLPVAGSGEPQMGQNEAMMLHLRDAQLFLSGDYECVCKSDTRQEFVHKLRVQVTVEPHVSVRPQFQWSLAGSLISFECQHDFIDTNASKARDESHIEQHLDWFKIDHESGHRQPIEKGGAQPEWQLSRTNVGNSSADTQWPRASFSMGSTRLVLGGLQPNHTGRYECQVTVPLDDGSSISSAASGRLLVQDGASPELPAATAARHHLWKFHERGISVYRVDEDEGQELELVRELSGHEEIRAEVDGNWNQLTLCGGLNAEQAVICEWSDNAVELRAAPPAQRRQQDEWSEARNYIYVGQPNLNRLLVLDGSAFTIVAVVNSEPQPRKLFAFRPNKIHLSKWLRRRLSPLANARWLQAIESWAKGDEPHQRPQQQAHPLELTPKWSRLYSDDGRQEGRDADERAEAAPGRRVARQATGSLGGNQSAAPQLVQYDIWLLCYGQPLVVDPNSEAADEEQSSGARDNRSAVAPGGEPRAATWPLIQTHFWLADAGAREARLRNRKSIQIIQSTFFPRRARKGHAHVELPAMSDIEAQSGFHADDKQEERPDWLEQGQRGQQTTSDSPRAVNEFKRLSVLTTHYVMAGRSVRGRQSEAFSSILGRAGPIDLVQDLSVPTRPEWLMNEARLKLHYAYAMHYEQRQLYRIAMDTYHYDRQLDLADCDPTSLLTTLQGLLVVQCRAPITHKPLGQLVLDELTGAKIQFNANICAQDNYLSPDSRYLISVFNNRTAPGARHSTVVYVQQAAVDGLAFQYEIKTTLEIVQCSFVWKEGYYAAVFVALNGREQQSELLSLRLADSRLELMVRVPGLVQLWPRHRQPLNILHQLKMASLSTSEGTHIVDLDENRIIQTLRHHHQSAPTLLWT